MRCTRAIGTLLLILYSRQYDNQIRINGALPVGDGKLMRKIAYDIVRQHFPGCSPRMSERTQQPPWSGAANDTDFIAVSQLVPNDRGFVSDDDTQRFDDGTVRHPDKTWTFPDGTVRHANGEWSFNDGTCRDGWGQWRTETPLGQHPEQDDSDWTTGRPDTETSGSYDPNGDNDKYWPMDDNGEPLSDRQVVHQ